MTTEHRDSADAAEQNARIAKLVAERHVLENQLTTRAQRLEFAKAFGAPIAAVVAAGGLLFSTTQWYLGTRATRQAEQQQRIERHLERLAAPTASQRITAVASLRLALSGDKAAAAEQAVAALTELLAVESSPAVRNAIVSALSTISGPGANSRRADTLIELIDVSRGLVREGQLWRLRERQAGSLDDPAGTVARATSVGHVIAVLLRQGARSSDMSGVYLSDEDLTGLDLSRIHFDRAVLVETDFDRATLDNATFDDAVLAGATFRHGRLRGASFRQSIRVVGSGGRINYVLAQVYALQQAPDTSVAVIGPYFDDADLSNSVFDGHPIFPIYDNELHQRAIISGFSFARARLEGVNLRNAWWFGIRRRDIRVSPCNMQRSLLAPLISFGGAPLELLAGPAANEDPQPTYSAECRRTMELLGMAFSGASRSKGLSPDFIEVSVAGARSAG